MADICIFPSNGGGGGQVKGRASDMWRPANAPSCPLCATTEQAKYLFCGSENTLL